MDNDSQFALYWTDLDPDNVMVDDSGQVLIVDVENIIVVDRWQINKGEGCSNEYLNNKYLRGPPTTIWMHSWKWV